MASIDSCTYLSSKYKIERKIGKGTYGSVYLAKEIATDQKVAIKNSKSIFRDALLAKCMLREISILRSLNHPNIIKIKNIVIPQACQNFNNLFVVMELAETDFRTLTRSSMTLSHEQVQSLIYQAVCGCRYMQSANVMHRDLKPANILINSNGNLKICDFGLSRTCPKPELVNGTDKQYKRALTWHVVSRWYRAPEVILVEKFYGKEMDVWSLGCVFAEMLGMMHPGTERSALFPGASCFPLSPDLTAPPVSGGFFVSEGDQLNKIFEIIGTPSEEDLEFVSDPKAFNYVKSFQYKPPADLSRLYPNATSEELDLLQRFLAFSPKNRITLDEALEHPYFTSIRNPLLESKAEAQAEFVFDENADIDMQTLRDYFKREEELYRQFNH